MNRKLDKENEKNRIRDQLMLIQMTEREAIERSDLNFDTVINAMNQQYTNKLNEMDAEYAKKEKALVRSYHLFDIKKSNLIEPIKPKSQSVVQKFENIMYMHKLHKLLSK